MTVAAVVAEATGALCEEGAEDSFGVDLAVGRTVVAASISGSVTWRGNRCVDKSCHGEDVF